MSSLNAVSINDTDSNIDLNALESDSESYYSSESPSDVSSSDSVRHQPDRQQPILPAFVPAEHNSKNRQPSLTDGDSSRKHPTKRQITKISYQESFDSLSKNNTGRHSNVLASMKADTSDTANFTNTITNTDTFSGDDYDDSSEHKDLLSDSYSYDYMSNIKSKPGDKLKTSWSNAMQNERQYKDLQIINEVSKLQNLNFFSIDYTKNLEILKLSQLSLLQDMVKLSENSFDEFFKIWDNIDTNENEDDVFSSDIQSISKPDSDSLRQMFNESTFVTDIENKEANRRSNLFDINNNEGFKLMEQRKNDILADLEKINESIDQIDSFTKSMWSNI